MKPAYFVGIGAALIVGAFAGYEYGFNHGVSIQRAVAQSQSNAPQSGGSNSSAPGPDNSTPMQKPPPSPEVRAAARSMREACAADAASLCQGMPLDHGGMQKCLRSHSDQLSAGCKTAWQNLKAVRQAARSAQGPQDPQGAASPLN